MRIPYTEVQSWLALSGEIVSREELNILHDMDDAYCNAVAKEIEANKPKEESN